MPAKKEIEFDTQVITMTRSDFDEQIKRYVDAAVKAAMSDQGRTSERQAESQRRLDVDSIYAGMTVPTGTMPPAGWQLCAVENGTFQVWPLPPTGFDPEIRRKTLDQVDRSYRAMLPGRSDLEAGRATMPSKLLVNVEFRQLFADVQSWGDSCHILVDEVRFSGMEGPRFEFVCPEPGQRR